MRTTTLLVMGVLLGAQALNVCPQSTDTTLVPGPVVRTASGSVRGTVDGEVATFKGIPFAAAPIGD